MKTSTAPPMLNYVSLLCLRPAKAGGMSIVSSAPAAHNHVHGRTPYEDDGTPGRRRHLVRLWLRAGDRRQFRG